MLVSVIGRYAEECERELDPYVAWTAALQRLHDDWVQGQRPGIAQLRGYLAAVPEAHQGEALQDLIAAHLRLAWQTGRGPCLESYLAEFADELEGQATAAQVPADLVEDEFLARCQVPHGDAPLPASYDERFPARPDIHTRLHGRCLGAGRYVRLHLRGRGAMGEVHEALDRRLGRRVALKQPRADLADDSALRDHLAVEARLAAALEHPGTVAVHEYHEAGDEPPFYVMGLVEGPTLAERIRLYHQPPADPVPGEQRLLWHQLLTSFVAIGDAVAHAHGQGVLHRDLKPGNIVVGADGETVILDWGLGRQLGANGAGAGGAVVGTPEYMAPEQADGAADVRSDVFSLGAILYEILTGRPPHVWEGGIRPDDWPRLVREAHIPGPRSLHPGASAALEAVCLKALARDPADRYASARALALEVRRHLAGEPVLAWTEPMRSRVWRWLAGPRA